jgi:hypothetical protein
MCVRLSAGVKKNRAPTGRVFFKADLLNIFRKTNIIYIYIYDHTSPLPFTIKNVSGKTFEKIKIHILFSITFFYIRRSNFACCFVWV